MKKRFSAIILALALCAGLAVPTFAAEGKTVTTPDGKFQLTNVVDTAVIDAKGEDAQYINGQTVYLVNAAGARLTLAGVENPDETNMGYVSYAVEDGILVHEDAGVGFWDEDWFGAPELDEERQKADEAYFQDGMGDIFQVSITDFETDEALATIWIAFVKEDYEPAPSESAEPTTPAEPPEPAQPVTPAIPAFTDVKEGAYYEDAVEWAVAHEPAITNGTSDTTFEPETTCTQAQILTFLYRAAQTEGTASAEDMAAAQDWAKEKGMIGDGFDGGKDCTRATAVSYIWQAFDKPEADQSQFKDVDAEADYAAAVDWAVANGVTNGTNLEAGEFSPDDTCTRGQIVTFLHRAYVEEVRLPVAAAE